MGKNICPICHAGGEQVKLCHRGTRDIKEIDVYRCKSCGTRFLSHYNENDYESGFMYKSDNRQDLTIEQKLEILKMDDERRAEEYEQICSGKRVLDFGAGLGGFLSRIKNVSAWSGGVELGKEERDYLRQQKIPCRKDIDEYGDEKFDVVTAFNVFEHLAEPAVYLQKIAGYLAKDGILILELPNADDALLSFYQCDAFADFTYWSAHYYLPTMKSMSMLIESTGKYNIVKCEQFQRYPLSNHLMWLAKGKPGGHNAWDFFNDDNMDKLYSEKLKLIEGCDSFRVVCMLKCDCWK